MDRVDYYQECLAEAFDEAGIQATPEQLKLCAEHVEGAADSVGMAFYSPPASDRYNEIEREWKRKYDTLRAEFDRYQGNAETAVKKALRQYSDANVSIGEHGEVTRYGGRIERIQ